MPLPEEIEPRLAALREKIGGMKSYLDLDRHRSELARLEEAAAAPGFWDDPKKAQETIAETNAHKAVLRPYDDLVSRLSDADTMLELAREEPDRFAVVDASKPVPDVTAEIRGIVDARLFAG